MWRMIRGGARKDGQSGAAVTEMALLTLVLAPTLLYSIFLYELAWTKIKAREVARYAMWELSAVGLSDWKKGLHDDRFSAHRQPILTEVAERFGDDLQSATPAYLTQGPKLLSLEVTVPTDQATLENLDAGLWNVGNDSFPIPSEVGSSVDSLFDRFGFTRKGQLEGEFRIHLQNTLLGRTMPVFYQDRMLLQDELDLSVKQSLLVELWDLKGGDAVLELHQTNCAGDRGSDFCHQVQRMSFVNLGDHTGNLLSSGQGGQAMLMRLLSSMGNNMHDPLEAVVASTPLEGEGNPAEISPDLYVPEDHGGVVHRNMQRRYFTSPYKDTKSNSESPYTKVYNKRGKFFLGCKLPEQQEGQCRYE